MKFPWIIIGEIELNPNVKSSVISSHANYEEIKNLEFLEMV